MKSIELSLIILLEMKPEERNWKQLLMVMMKMEEERKEKERKKESDLYSFHIFIISIF
jgi:hypothetical protein